MANLSVRILEYAWEPEGETEGLPLPGVKLEPPVYQEECDAFRPIEDNYVGTEWSASPLSEWPCRQRRNARTIKNWQKESARMCIVRESTSKHNQELSIGAGCKVKETWHIWCNYHHYSSDLKAAKIETCARCSHMYRCNICNNEQRHVLVFWTL